MTKQYIRNASLILSQGQIGREFAGLRIQFEVTKGDFSSPNTATIQIYNLNVDTRNMVQKEFQKVTLSAGYGDNLGLIFKGNIQRFWLGSNYGIEFEQNGVDHITTLVCADGDSALKRAVVVKTLDANSSIDDQIRICQDELSKYDISKGNDNVENKNIKLPRSKVMFGTVRDQLTKIATSTNSSWSIQDENLMILDKNKVLKNEQIVYNRNNGLIGIPIKGNPFLEFTVLLDNRLSIGTNIRIENVNGNDISGRIVTIKHKGDTHGSDWSTACKAMIYDVTTSKLVNT